MLSLADFRLPLLIRRLRFFDACFFTTPRHQRHAVFSTPDFERDV